MGSENNFTRKEGKTVIKKRLIGLLSHAKKYIVYQVIWQWLALLCQMIMIISMGFLIEQMWQGNLAYKNLFLYGLVVMIAMGLRFFFDRQSTYASYQASIDVKIILRDKIYEKLLHLGASYREQVATAQIVQMAGEGVEQLETYFGRYLPQFFYSLIAPITLFIVLSFISIKSSLVLLLCVPLIPISIVVIQKIAKRLLHKYWGIYTSLGDSFLENLQGLTTLKIYQADGYKAEEMEEEAQLFRKITMKVLTMQLNSISVMDIMAYGGAAIGMLVTLGELRTGKIGIAGAFSIILLAAEYFIPLRLLGSFFHIAMNGMAASDRIFALLDLPEGMQKTEKLEEKEITIHLERVFFSYEKEREILSDITLELLPSTFTALVGESGCGKSTIAGILMGRNKGYQGNIIVQKKQLSNIQEKSLMSKFTMVSHNSWLFKGTVRENLLMGKKEATEFELIEVLQKVNLMGFLEEQQGLDTFIMEKGSNLSGGQCQRLALARALLHDTPVYIFDEATSNIDVESEEMIMKIIYELAEYKTILFISHRLANVVKADSICMMEGGKISEKGTHQDLLKKKGAYAKLYTQQMELEQYRKGMPR